MRQADVERFRGRWVATDRLDDHVVVDAASLNQLHARLEGYAEPLLIQRVPSADEPIFFGLY